MVAWLLPNDTVSTRFCKPGLLPNAPRSPLVVTLANRAQWSKDPDRLPVIARPVISRERQRICHTSQQSVNVTKAESYLVEHGKDT